MSTGKLLLWIILVVVLVVRLFLRLRRRKLPVYVLGAAQRELARLRKGSRDYWEPTQIDEALRAGWSLLAIGTTDEELAEFRRGKSKLIYAAEWLAKYRRGEVGSIKHLIGFLVRGKIRPEDIGTSQQEFESCLREEFKKFLLERLELLRSAATASSDDHLMLFMDPDRVCAELSGGGISLEELGTTQEELDSLQKRAWLNQAKLWWRHRKEGIEGGASFSILDFSRLFGMLRRAGAKIADLGISVADMGALKRKNFLLLARSTLETLRQRIWFLPMDGHYMDMGEDIVLPGDPEPYVQLLREQLAKAKVSLEDIGSNQEEIDSLMAPAYLYSATFLLYWTRKLVEEWIPEYPRDQERSRNIAAIRTFLERVGKKPEDIKTTEEELHALAPAPVTC